MPMSNGQWAAWRPEKLIQDELPAAEMIVSAQPADAASDPAFQAELARIRKQAEQKGFAHGEQHGIEEGKKQGYEQGLQLGREDGIAQGAAEFMQQQQKQAQQFAHLIESFQAALDNLDSAMPSRLVQVALTAARTMFGDSIVSGSTHTWLLEHIQTLLRQENLLQGKAKLWVSGEESALVKEQLGNVLESKGWELCIDPQMLPGGCRITTDEGELDATTETRWNALCNLSREDYF
ncbi:flagellar assembly protein FliH [Vagococcus sp. WN89Y]|uniref:flagellar assembly protein FliH n=1 Tax=Vagococcus sp. WN89Y TaxID=3457258 RepID=UPI003FCC4DA1